MNHFQITPLKIARPQTIQTSMPATTPEAPERKSFSGRRVKAPPSREYPGHDEASFNSSASKKRVRAAKPTLSSMPASYPMTPGPMTAQIATGTSLQDYLRTLQNTLHIPATSVLSYDSPNTPPLPTPMSRGSELPPDLAAALSERPHRQSSKNIAEFAPSLVSKDIKRKSLASSGGLSHSLSSSLSFKPMPSSIASFPSKPSRKSKGLFLKKLKV